MRKFSIIIVSILMYINSISQECKTLYGNLKKLDYNKLEQASIIVNTLNKDTAKCRMNHLKWEIILKGFNSYKENYNEYKEGEKLVQQNYSDKQRITDKWNNFLNLLDTYEDLIFPSNDTTLLHEVREAKKQIDTLQDS